jgi:putative nucleotidyltransferase with HDIG domain
MSAVALDIESPPCVWPAASEAPTEIRTVAHQFAENWVCWLAEHTGVPWFGWSAKTGALLARSAERLPAYWPFCNGATATKVGPQFVEPEPGLLCCVYSPRDASETVVLTSYVLTESGRYPAELVLAAVDQQLDDVGQEFDLARVPVCSRGLFERLVIKTLAQRTESRRIASLEAELGDFRERMGEDRAEIALLHAVTQQLRLSTNPVELARFCLDQVQHLIESESHVITLQDSSGELHRLESGVGPLNDVMLARLLAHYDDYDWSRPLVRNQVRQSLLGADFPELENFVIVAIADGELRRGWIVSTNRQHGQFGPKQANVLQSVAHILATHLRNVELYDSHQELMVGFARSLVSTLDAKDPYTRGHSERVALVARRIGAELGLPDSDLEDIYLAGLLHDIGKVGIDDRILQKPDQLTEEEFRHIQQHPIIGFNILKELGNLQHVLAGVRNHHESWNGRGYPDRLQGEGIPLMARIMSVADSHDAMKSDRPYRRGMTQERVEEIFRRGAGQQWDPRVITAYFAARDAIVRLCDRQTSTDGSLLPDCGLGTAAAVTTRRKFGS